MIPNPGDGDASSTRTVYRWEKWEEKSRRFVVDPNYATADVIAAHGGFIFHRTGLVVDATRLGKDGVIHLPTQDPPLEM